MNKKALSERDICTKYITPALKQAGWDEFSQIREEVYFTKGRIIVRGRLVTRGKAKRADYILYYRPNIPLAIIEDKDNNHSIGDGIQQALESAVALNIPFVFSSNGDGFVFHDRTGASPQRECANKAWRSRWSCRGSPNYPDFAPAVPDRGLRELALSLDLVNPRPTMGISTSLLWTRRLAAGLWAGAACVRAVMAGPATAEGDQMDR